MAILSWGKPKIETAVCKDGMAGTDWTPIDTPQQDTTNLNPTSGDTTDAQEEGGDIVDSRTAKTTYEFEFTLFVKKGGKRPFEDDDGVVSGEHAFRLTPEDEACEGILIDRSTVRLEEQFNTANGKLLHYIARCLKPTTGKTIKPYVKTATVHS